MDFSFLESKDHSNACFETDPRWFEIYSVSKDNHFTNETYELKVAIERSEYVVALGSLAFCKQMAYKYADMLDDINELYPSLDRNSIMPLPVLDQFRLWDNENEHWSSPFDFKSIRDSKVTGISDEDEKWLAPYFEQR